jgi:hypothetical protein
MVKLLAQSITTKATIITIMLRTTELKKSTINGLSY